MTDKRFKWVLTAASLTVIAVAFIWKYPEAAKAHASRDARLGEYVYYDPIRQTIHIDRKCKILNRRGSKCERIEISHIVDWREESDNTIINNICPNCISDKDYELIMSTIQEQIFDKYDK
ncbi:MAG: hypothetical protein K2M06_02010 [Muribaculaceae bacterium]|nr:hypothetical protein [Muribaculaceae bacterium]